MSNLFKLVGLIVVLLVLASSGIMRGDMCVGSIGCVGAKNDGITFHASK